MSGRNQPVCRLPGVVAVSAALAFCQNAAAAQDLEKGMPAGGGMFYPTLTVTQAYDDNMFLLPVNEKGSWLTVIAPKGVYQYEGTTTRFGLNLELEQGIYYSSTDDNYTDAAVVLDGAYFPTDRLELAGEAGYLKEHQARGEGNTEFIFYDRFDHPDRYHEIFGEAGVKYGLKQQGAPRVGLGVRYEDRNYDNNREWTVTQDRETTRGPSGAGGRGPRPAQSKYFELRTSTMI